MKKLTVKKDNPCMACLSCVLACSNAYYKVEDPGKSCIQIIERNGAPRPMTCVQCGKCASVCEAGAITQNPKGVYMVNRKLCTGCGKCVEACPFGLMVKAEDTPYSSKCTACGICVKACPMDILEIVEK
ncbi:MAG: 4Fe-4S binding protein [Oscillospiraceae bacterium]|nr:4Fe-4S binding protein [Oscillospiraceae bacterium]